VRDLVVDFVRRWSEKAEIGVGRFIPWLGVTASKFYDCRPLSSEDAKRLIQQYVDRYNYIRLHSAIGYVTPNDMLAGRQIEIHAQRDRKLEAARQQRRSRRQQAA
jgi:Integrase core domain